MNRSAHLAVVIWLAAMLVCGWIISRSQFTADLSAFLPRSPSPEQQILLAQISDGFASRLILVGISGSDAPTRARISTQMAHQLRNDAAFVSVNNGEPVTQQHDHQFLLANRYLLSAAVTPERFSVTGLRHAIDESIALLASPAGLLVKPLLPRDPTGEMLNLLEHLNSGSRPRHIEGAWASKDGSRALLLIQTRASGSDTDAQQRAVLAIRHAFDAANAQAQAQLVMTGPGVFSVTSRETIKQQVSQLSILSFALIATMLLLVYRSFSALVLGFLPVLSGVLAGIAAVSVGFGVVHGITLGFGTALIGEAIDYSIYLFVQSEQRGQQQAWVKRYWPTVRLGVLTSVFGFASLLLSGFPGLAQLGLYAVAGLAVAAGVTRFVLPHLLPTNFRIHDVTPVGRVLAEAVQSAPRLRMIAGAMLLFAISVLIARHDHLWNDTIASLSPVSQADVAMDARLRAELGAPDVRYLVVVSGPDQQSVLRSAENVSAVLQALVEQGELAGFESPSRYLPSIAMQRARQASLPDATELRTRLALAVHDLPVRASIFEPFIRDVSRAKDQPLLQASDLQHTSMAMAVDALLVRQGSHWRALMPLTAPANGDIHAPRIQRALQNAGTLVLFVDMKSESDRLYAGYLHEAILLSLGGVGAILLLLLLVFRSPKRLLRVAAPLAAAVVTVTAGLALFGQQLIILHLIGLLLVVAIGSNYALFFDQPTVEGVPGISARTLASMLLANLTTVVGFGLLAFSNVSLLQALGVTVAPGVILALLYAAIFARRQNA